MKFFSSLYGILEGVFIACMWREPEAEKLLTLIKDKKTYGEKIYCYQSQITYWVK